MSALFAIFMSCLKAGDHFIACSSIFDSTHTIITKYLVRWGISYSNVPDHDLQHWEAAIQTNTKLIFFETPTNPGLEVIDIEAVVTIAKKHKLLTIVDNCFATPVIQQPITLGVDLVMHSATKWLDWQGRVMGRVVAGCKESIKEIALFCRSTGPALSPFNAWVLSKSLETLALRMERHASSASWLVQQLQKHPAISVVKYPLLQYPSITSKQMKNGGAILCFELTGGLTAGQQFLNGLQMICVTANLGDSRSIASHPASTTHAKLTDEERLVVSITPGLIRISVGLENKEDILNDIFQALNSIKPLR